MIDLVLQGAGVPTFLIDRCLDATGARGVRPCPPQSVRLAGAARSLTFDEELAPLLFNEGLDWAFVRADMRLADFGLLAFDMDSTLISVECIDELAALAGRKEEVAAITAAAMRGELDYRTSLQQRLACLAGLDAKALARVYDERVRLSPGAAELIEAAKRSGLRTAILSGGFTYFTERLRIEHGLDCTTSNVLEIAGGKLTGRVIGEIVDGAAKARHLQRLCEEFGLRREQVIAIGDGANDLPMLAAAGLAVAYRAKPAIRNKADIALNFSALDGLLNLCAE